MKLTYQLHVSGSSRTL